MSSLVVARFVLLSLGLVALLLATVLHGVLIDRVVQPWLRYGERMSGQPAALPRSVARLFERGWPARAWHVAWAALFLGAWWYLGTAAGAALWSTLSATGS